MTMKCLRLCLLMLLLISIIVIAIIIVVVVVFLLLLLLLISLFTSVVTSLVVHIVQDRDWCEYWRLLFPKITVDDIRNFEGSYRGSEEERDALKSVYLDKEGDMDAILENVCLCVCVCVCEIKSVYLSDVTSCCCFLFVCVVYVS